MHRCLARAAPAPPCRRPSSTLAGPGLPAASPAWSSRAAAPPLPTTSTSSSPLRATPPHRLAPAPDNDDGDGEPTSFLHRVSHASSAAESPKDTLSFLLSSSPAPSSHPSPTSPSLLPKAAALALLWRDECGVAAGDEGVGSPPFEEWHLAIWAAGRAGRFDLVWAAAAASADPTPVGAEAASASEVRAVLLNGVHL